MESLGAIQDEGLPLGFIVLSAKSVEAKLCDLLERLGLLILALSSLVSEFPKDILVPS
jgi:hypothetical protein